MRNILFEPRPLPPSLTRRSPGEPPPCSRRLLAITLALQLSGAPAPNTMVRLLLTRYVAGQVSLAEILPLVG